jgi:hypothetical protein
LASRYQDDKDEAAYSVAKSRKPLDKKSSSKKPSSKKSDLAAIAENWSFAIV